jgi:hypothetical protein
MANIAAWDKVDMKIEAGAVEEAVKDIASSGVLNTVVIDGNTVINGDLLITGKIKKAFKFKLNAESLAKVVAFLSSEKDVCEGKDYYVAIDGIIVSEEDKIEYKGLVMEALV